MAALATLSMCLLLAGIATLLIAPIEGGELIRFSHDHNDLAAAYPFAFFFFHQMLWLKILCSGSLVSCN